ncbi:MAG TPA: THUMP domain-containing protein [Spirochaetia bacterium]|nr:THUMP domain-containing protein [Spirochaetia bacterium]
MTITATTLSGLESVLESEIADLNLAVIGSENRAVTFKGSLRELYLSLYHLRTALRLLVHITSFDARDPQELYRSVGRIDWSAYLDGDQTFAIDCTANSSIFRHTDYAALKAKDAIVDQFRTRTGRRPSVRTDFPNLRIHLHIEGTRCTVSRDAAGESLHRRGYRSRAGEAPLNEVLAAGMILLSGWKPGNALVDPFCGSGTIAIEAAMIGAGISPGSIRRRIGAGEGARRRRPQERSGSIRAADPGDQTIGREAISDRTAYGCQSWKDFDRQLWEEIPTTATNAPAEENPRDLHDAEIGPQIFGFDLADDVLVAARENAKSAGVNKLICFDQADVRELHPEALCGGRWRNDLNPGVIVTNPPYGERLSDLAIDDLYRATGDTFKRAFPGWHAWVLSGNMAALKRVGLRSERRIPLHNGPIECRFVHYPLAATRAENSERRG